MILGDGEIVFKNVLEILKQDLSKKEKLERLAEISGVYVPYISTNVKKVTETLNDVIYTHYPGQALQSNIHFYYSVVLGIFWFVYYRFDRHRRLCICFQIL